MTRWMRIGSIRAIMWIANRLDVGVVLVVVDYNSNKTGVSSNLGNRFPDSQAKDLMLDTLRTAVHIVKGHIAPAQPGEDS